MESPIEYNFFMLAKRFDTINGILLIYIILYSVGIFILPKGINNVLSECMTISFPYIVAFLFLHFLYISRKIKRQYLKEIFIPFILYILIFYVLYILIYNK